MSSISWNAIPTAFPNPNIALRVAGSAPASTAPVSAAAAMSDAVLQKTTVRYSFSVIPASRVRINWSTSPSERWTRVRA